MATHEWSDKEVTNLYNRIISTENKLSELEKSLQKHEKEKELHFDSQKITKRNASRIPKITSQSKIKWAMSKKIKKPKGKAKAK